MCFAGINTAYTYLGGTNSCTGIHVEDGDAKSANILLEIEAKILQKVRERNKRENAGSNWERRGAKAPPLFPRVSD